MSILPLLPLLRAAFQGSEAVAVSVDSSHGPVLVALQVLFRPRGPFLAVGLNIEVCEERDQGDHISDLEIQPPEGEATPPEESAARLNDCQHKLDQLPLSDVFFPPEVGTYGRNRGQTIVRVHEDVDEGVECRSKIRMAAGNPVHHKPPDVEHGGVVVDMEDRYLVVVLAEDEEEGVHEFYEFGEVVPPQDTDDLHVCLSC